MNVKNITLSRRTVTEVVEIKITGFSLCTPDPEELVKLPRVLMELDRYCLGRVALCTCEITRYKGFEFEAVIVIATEGESQAQLITLPMPAQICLN